MQRKKKRSRPALLMAIAMVMAAGVLIHGAQAQSALLMGESGSLAEIVQADGQVRLPGITTLCAGWKLRIDPMLRARFVQSGASGTACRTRTDASTLGYWDDQLLLPGVTGQVRAFRAGDEVVYVDSRFAFRHSGITVSGILKWDAITGRWHVVGNPPATKPGVGAVR